jgi:5-methylcytosine-specific restriction endonuclease McrA
MPTSGQKAQLLARDGHHCRFCGIPLIRAEVRRRFTDAYPSAARWGRRNVEQHAALQAMWVQYDHILPNARGGATDLSNLVITCAPCNFGRTDLTLEEVGLLDPRSRPPIRSAWDGLERFRP